MNTAVFEEVTSKASEIQNDRFGKPVYNLLVVDEAGDFYIARAFMGKFFYDQKGRSEEVESTAKIYRMLPHRCLCTEKFNK